MILILFKTIDSCLSTLGLSPDARKRGAPGPFDGNPSTFLHTTPGCKTSRRIRNAARWRWRLWRPLGHGSKSRTASKRKYTTNRLLLFLLARTNYIKLKAYLWIVRTPSKNYVWFLMRFSPKKVWFAIFHEICCKIWEKLKIKALVRVFDNRNL